MQAPSHIQIDEESRIPKYQQIVNSIIGNVASGRMKIGQKIPSINTLSEEYYLSRDTVEKAYNILKERNIIVAVRGKGYYIARTELLGKANILFMINKLSSYKMRIYNSFINSIGTNSHTDLHIYHCDEQLFLSLLKKNLGTYDYYVIMPHFLTSNLRHISAPPEVTATIRQIPPEKLVIMDNNKIDLPGDYIQIYQDFQDDIYRALKQGLSKIRNYNKLFIVFPHRSVYPYPRRILFGFRQFCVEFNLAFEVIETIYEDMVLQRGDLFITIEEADLVNLVKQIRDHGYSLGTDIGIISYNDTPLKELLGITVISTDFRAMGETAARMILRRETGKVRNPFELIDRQSL